RTPPAPLSTTRPPPVNRSFLISGDPRARSSPLHVGAGITQPGSHDGPHGTPRPRRPLGARPRRRRRLLRGGRRAGTGPAGRVLGRGGPVPLGAGQRRDDHRPDAGGDGAAHDDAARRRRQLGPPRQPRVPVPAGRRLRRAAQPSGGALRAPDGLLPRLLRRARPREAQLLLPGSGRQRVRGAALRLTRRARLRGVPDEPVRTAARAGPPPGPAAAAWSPARRRSRRSRRRSPRRGDRAPPPAADWHPSPCPRPGRRRAGPPAVPGRRSRPPRRTAPPWPARAGPPG